MKKLPSLPVLMADKKPYDEVEGISLGGTGSI